MPVYVGKLDTRFADEEDAADLLQLVNEAYAVETKGPHAFRSGDRIGDNELSESLSSSNSRWLVCETPAPEERMLACLHFRLSSSETGGSGGSTAYLTCLAVDPEAQRKGVGRVLLRRAETIMRNLGCRFTRTEAAAVREDVEGFLSACGYREVGGGMCAELSRPELLDQATTRFVTYQKDLAVGPPGTAAVKGEEETPMMVGQEEAEVLSSVVEILESLGLDARPEAAAEEDDEEGGAAAEAALSEEAEDGKGGSGGGGGVEGESDDVSLEDIIGELFKVLRTDEGRAEFERLVREQDEGGQVGEEPAAS